MKKCFALALLLLTALLAGCGSEEKPGEIYGTWKISERNHYIFGKDGSFTDKDVIDNSMTEKGTFVLFKETLTISVGSGKRVFTILSLTTKMAKTRAVRDGKPMTGHYRWERVD